MYNINKVFVRNINAYKEKTHSYFDGCSSNISCSSGSEYAPSYTGLSKDTKNNSHITARPSAIL